MGLHVEMTLLAFRVFPILSFLFLLASVYSETFPRRVTIVWAVLSVVLTAFVIVLGWGPSMATVSGLRFQVVAQKFVAVTAVVALFIISVEADRALGTTHA
jgi:hypothetical protein